MNEEMAMEHVLLSQAMLRAEKLMEPKEFFGARALSAYDYDDFKYVDCPYNDYADNR